MLALAIVLLLVVGILVIVSFAGSSEEIVIEFLNVTITTSVGGVFVSGVVCGLIALASMLGLRRSWRLNQARAEEVRELRRLAGIPDPDETESAATESSSAPSQATAESGRTSADGDRGKTGGADDDQSKTGGTSSANLAAPSSDTNDTAPLPDPEDPPRT